jgi:hypothetical protein
MHCRRCQRVGIDVPAAWDMPEVHGERFRLERCFGGEAVLSQNTPFSRFSRLALSVMRDSVVEWINRANPHVLVAPEKHRGA